MAKYVCVIDPVRDDTMHRLKPTTIPVWGGLQTQSQIHVCNYFAIRWLLQCAPVYVIVFVCNCMFLLLVNPACTLRAEGTLFWRHRRKCLFLDWQERQRATKAQSESHIFVTNYRSCLCWLLQPKEPLLWMCFQNTHRIRPYFNTECWEQDGREKQRLSIYIRACLSWGGDENV